MNIFVEIPLEPLAAVALNVIISSNSEFYSAGQKCFH